MLDADALSGRLLFAIPKKGPCILHGQGIQHILILLTTLGRLHEKCLELLAGEYLSLRNPDQCRQGLNRVRRKVAARVDESLRRTRGFLTILLQYASFRPLSLVRVRRAGLMLDRVLRSRTGGTETYPSQARTFSSGKTTGWMYVW